MSQFLGTSSLVEQLDSMFKEDKKRIFIRVIMTTLIEKMLIVLRDGRHLVGILRSFDQFCTNDY